MATRSYIGTVEDNKVKYIYCHFDGYLEGVGRILAKNYNTPFKVNALLELGDISELRETPETCVAYHRDKGEKFNSAGSHLKDLIIKDDSVDYVYLFNLETFEWDAYSSSGGKIYHKGECITEDLQIKASIKF